MKVNKDILILEGIKLDIEKCLYLKEPWRYDKGILTRELVFSEIWSKAIIPSLQIIQVIYAGGGHFRNMDRGL